MRQRKIKNEEERLAEHSDYIAKRPMENKGRWHRIFENHGEIYIELGCGKGKFILDLAEKNPQNNYIGIEGRGSVVLRALEKASDKKLRNLIFINEYIKNIEDYFEEDELSGIYLNFSDPWPKDRHAKRRLTHINYLEGYKKVLKSGQFIDFKTDNEGLFDYALEEFEKAGVEILECTKDLHGSELAAKNITTEYEEKFVKEGKKINYCKVRP